MFSSFLTHFGLRSENFYSCLSRLIFSVLGTLLMLITLQHVDWRSYGNHLRLGHRNVQNAFWTEFLYVAHVGKLLCVECSSGHISAKSILVRVCTLSFYTYPSVQLLPSVNRYRAKAKLQSTLTPIRIRSDIVSQHKLEVFSLVLMTNGDEITWRRLGVFSLPKPRNQTTTNNLIWVVYFCLNN